MAALEKSEAPDPDFSAPAGPSGAGWLARVARSALLPLAFGGSGLCVGLLVGLWQGIEAANGAGGAVGRDSLGSVTSGLVVFVLYAAGGLAAGLSLGMAIVVGMSFQQRTR